MTSQQQGNYETIASNLLIVSALVGNVKSFYNKSGFFDKSLNNSTFELIGFFIIFILYLAMLYLIRKGFTPIKIAVLVMASSIYFINIVSNSDTQIIFLLHSNAVIQFLTVLVWVAQLAALVLICLSLQRPQTDI